MKDSISPRVVGGFMLLSGITIMLLVLWITQGPLIPSMLSACILMVYGSLVLGADL